MYSLGMTENHLHGCEYDMRLAEYDFSAVMMQKRKRIRYTYLWILIFCTKTVRRGLMVFLGVPIHLSTRCLSINEPPHNKTNKVACSLDIRPV